MSLGALGRIKDIKARKGSPFWSVCRYIIQAWCLVKTPVPHSQWDEVIVNPARWPPVIAWFLQVSGVLRSWRKCSLPRHWDIDAPPRFQRFDIVPPAVGYRFEAWVEACNLPPNHENHQRWTVGLFKVGPTRAPNLEIGRGKWNGCDATAETFYTRNT